jgi:dTDP-4-dehydrorhamnose 3,5-epimerase
MKFQSTPIKDAVLIEPQVFGDARGFFLESWQAEKFATAGITATFVQDNHSRSSQWTLRGLHFQVEHTQGKLVRVTTGSVFDVIVDLRRSFYSPAHERTLAWNDSKLAIQWPLPPGTSPKLSAKDAQGSCFEKIEKFA